MQHPETATTNGHPHGAGRVSVKTAAEQDAMRLAGRLTAEVLDMIGPHVVAGVSTDELDRICHDYIVNVQKAVPAPLDYRGFPKSICTSVNHVVCHGIPGDRRLRQGDIVNIDVTVIKDGWHGDSSRMFYVGTPSIQAKRLVEATYEAMWRGIRAVRAGAHLGDIGSSIQRFAEGQGFSIVREFCGHGIGQVFHASPNIVHVGPPGAGEILQEGMFFTIEPMINIGKPHVKILSDGWTAVTRDRTLSAQCEHSIGITETGCEIFTASPAGLFNPVAAQRQ